MLLPFGEENLLSSSELKQAQEVSFIELSNIVVNDLICYLTFTLHPFPNLICGRLQREWWFSMGGGQMIIQQFTAQTMRYTFFFTCPNLICGRFQHNIPL